MRVLVTGGTGTLGGATLPALTEAGHEVLAISRHDRPRVGPVSWSRADLATGEGLHRAVAGAGADAVVHLASAPYQRGYTRRVDVDGTRRLVAAARAAGVGHLLYVSIVGVDRIPWGYFRIKVEAEEVVRAGGAGWTILRATQFHPFLATAVRAAARLPAIPVDPGIPVQPVATQDVAAHLVEQLEAGPTTDVRALGGPEVLTMEEAMAQWLGAAGVRRRLLRLRAPGRLAAAFRAGHLTTPSAAVDGITWQEYLTGQPDSPGPRSQGDRRIHR